MEIIKDKVIFSTGKEKYANYGVIGLSPDMYVHEGYDGYFHSHPEDWRDDDNEDDQLTKLEQIELADYMIEEWKKFKEQAR